MQTFEQIKLVKLRIRFSFLNKLTDMYTKPSGAVREAGNPEWWIFPHFLLIAVLTDLSVQQDMHESSGASYCLAALLE